MLIERIDVYWVRVPLAFVWTTSYGDQRHTDTILVRMQGGGHHAWGEGCPPPQARRVVRSSLRPKTPSAGVKMACECC